MMAAMFILIGLCYAHMAGVDRAAGRPEWWNLITAVVSTAIGFALAWWRGRGDH